MKLGGIFVIVMGDLESFNSVVDLHGESKVGSEELLLIFVSGKIIIHFKFFGVKNNLSRLIKS